MKLLRVILSLQHLEDSRGTIKLFLLRITGVTSSTKYVVTPGTLLSGVGLNVLFVVRV